MRLHDVHCNGAFVKAGFDTLGDLCAQVIRMVGESQDTVTVGGGSGSSSNKMPTLEEYGTNLTTQATEVRLGGVNTSARAAVGMYCTVGPAALWA